MPTDQQLKLALAKMLPDLILAHDSKALNDPGGVDYFWWKDYSQGNRMIHESEWFYICWLVEEQIENQPDYMLCNKYSALLEYVLEEEVKEENKDEDPDCIPDVIGFEWIHAGWQQRALALAKLKGIEV